ncbi:class Ib ribonucleoside-diphosphate reductase assembly flavoprotein NrdI [Enterococcus lemanii]|uniref:Class Ib ribonucleoside-diphosphate reductase assembly flavoprotein NrdI n=1 Tax=Enterococcus lemanii TaxID=1159752 RepID=A0ABV9N0W3_9ENTE|nr:class Ib ribonucleoside-diphosphate reductase assembly flavoprotein NrdI [Enterococcus lemanii]MBM7708277.1 protein involved in ribonucleotide reduction [Enterococcus lemanii]
MQPLKIHILYISLTGNTTYFMAQLEQYYAEKGVQLNAKNVKEILYKKEAFQKLEQPFATFLPAFLEGGNGKDNGDQEILTTPLKDYLRYQENYQRCYGIVGSGNRNFNKQFALTAHQYADYFHFPYLDEFELRGSQLDIVRIGELLIKEQTRANERQKEGV